MGSRRSTRPVGRPDLTLEGSEEAFHGGVVPAVALATHAGCDSVATKDPLVVVAGILHPAVGVVDEAGGWFPSGDGFFQYLAARGSIKALAGSPANHPARMEVENATQV